mmetsp:Transcript_6365/g.19225  ORF Transcript_6365/g.19225 Transcript_6365/m.19225 type:complete len:340 (-) Transcript_6365:249-1268(-)
MPTWLSRSRALSSTPLSAAVRMMAARAAALGTARRARLWPGGGCLSVAAQGGPARRPPKSTCTWLAPPRPKHCIRSFCQPAQPSQGESPPEPDGARVLWRARALTQELQAAEASLVHSAAMSGCGLGLGLLGVAPFVPPTPFMAGLLLSVLQVRLAHVWLSRQLRAQARRHVTELALAEGHALTSEGSAQPLVLVLKCDGGLSRTLRLSPGPAAVDGSKPALAEVLEAGRSFLFLDDALGSSDDPEALKQISQSQGTIANEDITVEPFTDESQEDANKVVQPLLGLTRAHIQKMKGKDNVSPAASLANIQRTAYLTAGIILAGGATVFAGGRYTAAKDS